MRLRALESNALLAETDESIAALLGGARTAEERFDAALGLSDGDGGPGVDDTTAQLPRSRAPVAGERGEAMPPIPKSLGPGAEGGLVRKSIGPGAAAPRKTLGRAVPEATNTAEGKDSGAPSRSQLARRISDHLSGALSASELAAFARTGWMALDDGAQFPAGERALLEPALRQLMFHDRPGAALDAPALISLLASLQ